MTIPSKSLKSGFSMPMFGIGTWEMGGRYIHNLLNNDKRDIESIKTAIDLGATHIDTAEMYALGYAEKLIAKAISDYDRSKLFLVSKVWPDWVKSRGDVVKACHKSLKRLNTDYLDLYLIHHADLPIPLKDFISAMDELVGEGSVKNIGVSNFSKERLREAQAYSKNKTVVNQVHYNLLFREPEASGLLDYCQRNDIMLVAWRPVEKGVLAHTGIDLMRQMCGKYGKTPAQIAINWLISQPNVVTIAKSSHINHLKENLGGVGWQMEQTDIERLRHKFPNQHSISDAGPLT